MPASRVLATSAAVPMVAGFWILEGDVTFEFAGAP
jgi:hypothetical protein